ncbi:hypothetical protein Neosp_003557 [[Neocosmospora] mangrovei]
MGKTGDGKIESFITGADIPAESKSKEEESPEQKETVTKPDDTTTDLQSSSKAETTSETAPKPQDDQDVKQPSGTQSEPPSTESLSEKRIDSVQETRDETTTQASTPASAELPLDSSDKNLDSSAEHPAESSGDSMFELPELPELEPSILPAKQFRHALVHDESLGVYAAPRKPPKVVQSQPVQPPSELDWNRLAPSEEESELSAEEIYRNIDELRPDTNSLRGSEIEKLTEVLRNGFTTDQLKEYIRLRKGKDKAVPKNDLGYAWVVKHDPWVPQTKTDVRGGQDKLASVQKVIYDTWKIQSQKEMDDVGTVTVQMQAAFFQFLTFESERMVRELRADFLVGEKETIIIRHKQQRLCIVARKATAYGILAHLDQIFQKRVLRDIPLRQHLARIPSEKELEVLSQLTNTVLKMMKNGKPLTEELRIAWLPDPQEHAAESKTEDKGDIVLRLLLGHPNPGREVDLECLPQPQTKGIPKSHFMNFRRPLKSLSWRDKLHSWQRVVTPIDNKTDEASPMPLDLIGSATLPEYHPDKLRSRNVTTATFGHILHNQVEVGNLGGTKTKKAPKKAAKKVAKSKSPDADADADDFIVPLHLDDLRTPGMDDEPFQAKKTKPIPGAVLSDKRRAFYPLIPHPASFSALKPEGSDTLTQSTTIILNLAVHGDRSNMKGPVIQVHLPVDAEADLANFSIPKNAAAYFVITWYRNELLLPGESVDVRIQHECRLALDMDKTGIRDFLDISEFNLLQGRLRTPSQTFLELPPEYINLAARSARPPEGQIYAFRGLEIHQTVEMPWRDHTLRYSSIEAGQHGGQRQELTLQAGKPDDPGTSFDVKKRQSFLQLVEDMAAGKCFSWTEGYKSIKSRQLEDHSYDLPEEELTEDIIVDDGKFDTYSPPNLRRYEEPKQPRKEYIPRRDTRGTPPRSKELDVLEEMEQFGKADEPADTKPKVQKPQVNQTSAKKPQKGQGVAKTKSPTDALHSFLNQFADPLSLTAPISLKKPIPLKTPISLKTSTGQPDGDRHVDDAALTNKILLEEVATRFNAQQAQEDSEARQSQKKPGARQPEEEPKTHQAQEDSTVHQVQEKPEAQEKSEARQPQEKPEARQPQKKPKARQPEEKPEARQAQEKSESRQPQKKPEARQPEEKPEARQAQEDSRARQAQEKPEARQAQEDSTAHQAQEKPGARQPQEKPEAPQPREKPAVRPTISDADFEAMFSARKSDKPLKATPPAKKSKQGTTKKEPKVKKQQAAPQAAPQPAPHSTRSTDPFATAFTDRRVTTPTHQRSSASGDGFFDNLSQPPAEKKGKPQWVKNAIKAHLKKNPPRKQHRWLGRGRVKRGRR